MIAYSYTIKLFKEHDILLILIHTTNVSIDEVTILEDSNYHCFISIDTESQSTRAMNVMF